MVDNFSYDNECGKGDRRDLVDCVYQPSDLVAYGNIDRMINGSYSTNCYFKSITIDNNTHIEFDFKEMKAISEITWKQALPAKHGMWNIECSLDNKNWQIMKENVELGVTENTKIQINKPIIFRYLRLTGVSGVTADPWLYQIEFKIRKILCKFIIRQNYHLYCIKSEYYSTTLENFTPLNTNTEKIYNTIIDFGFNLNDINETLENINIRPIDKFKDFKMIKLVE